MKNLRKALGLPGLLLAALGAPATAGAAAPGLTVFAAASLTNVMQQVGAVFTAETQLPVTFSFASSSTLARQIESGAPADVFLSADQEWMDYLQARQLVVPATRTDIVRNELVLVAPADSVVQLRIAPGFGLLAALGPSGRLATGDPASVPITEDFARSHTNPYGHSKLVCEDMLASVCQANSAWHVGVLRYFNPVGAHPSGLIGEDPSGVPNNLMPYVAQVAVGQRPNLNVYGNDYATPDGTGVRDYIHVQDLAQGHVAALQALLQEGPGDQQSRSGFTVNLGTGQGYSVLDVVHAFEQASGREVPYQFAPRRAGDVAQCYANASLAERLLGWRASHTLADMCRDAWHWQSSNPQGYGTVVGCSA